MAIDFPGGDELAEARVVRVQAGDAILLTLHDDASPEQATHTRAIVKDWLAQAGHPEVPVLSIVARRVEVEVVRVDQAPEGAEGE